MRRTIGLFAAIALGAAGSAFAMYEVIDRGTWAKTWPKELEPLRKTSRTLVGPTVPQQHFEIPFTNRESFEATWTHIVKVKSKGAPVILLRGPDARLGSTIKAGVRVHSPPPGQNENPATPEAPIAGVTNVRVRWMNTTFIELIVDGMIVDLNRIPLPADTPIVDERFEGAPRKAP